MKEFEKDIVDDNIRVSSFGFRRLYDPVFVERIQPLLAAIAALCAFTDDVSVWLPVLHPGDCKLRGSAEVLLAIGGVALSAAGELNFSVVSLNVWRSLRPPGFRFGIRFGGSCLLRFRLAHFVTRSDRVWPLSFVSFFVGSCFE